MLTIFDKNYIVEGNKITCQLSVKFNKDCGILNKLSCDVVYEVQRAFCKKYKNQLKGGFYCYKSQFEIVGVAKCNQSVDTFDKEKGAKIALYRALHKLNMMEMELMNMYSNKTIVDILMKFDRLQEKTRLHILDNDRILNDLKK